MAGSRLAVVSIAFLFLFSSSVCAEEETGLVQRLFRKFFGVPPAEQEFERNPLLPKQEAPAAGKRKLSREEIQKRKELQEQKERKEHEEQLIAEQDERENLEIIRRIKREQEARQIPERPPR